MAVTPPSIQTDTTPLSPEQLQKIDAYWRACCYLAVGMIYLRDNPLLREPLKQEHLKQRLLGHWGSSPGLAFMYVHLNRLIKAHKQSAIFLAGPGHGAPGVLAPVYLEGTFRTMNEPWRKRAHQLIEELSTEIAGADGGHVELEILKGYPVLHNHEAITKEARRLASGFLGEERVVDMGVRSVI